MTVENTNMEIDKINTNMEIDKINTNMTVDNTNMTVDNTNMAVENTNMTVDNTNTNMTVENINTEIENINAQIINIINQYQLFTNNDLDELTKSITHFAKDYIINNILAIAYAEFDKTLIKNIYNIFIVQIIHLFNPDIRYRVKFKLIRIIQTIKKQLYITLTPPRSYKNSFIRNINYNETYFNNISKKISILQNIIQPAQRSEEWYIFRHNLLTASSIWKVFGSQSTKNQIIYEKCKPYAIFGQISTTSPLHWGQKYEPISVEFYKKLYDTEISDFGCIKHSEFAFIGASPDGINTDPSNKRYGRMLEIKNVVSRVITGVPKMDYWVQMQLQMETCDLNECDFLETKFMEYESEEQFLNDGSYTFTQDDKPKGRMILFSLNGRLHYEYAPLYCTEEEYCVWEEQILDKNSEMEWIQNIFWKLEKYSNILVLRNKLWFKTAVPHIENLWNIIINERNTGYEHRAPNSKKRTAKTGLIVNKCYIVVGDTPTPP